MYVPQRTPTKKSSENRRSTDKVEPAGPAQASKVRRSIGEWESGKAKSPSPSLPTPPKKVTVPVAGPSRPKAKNTLPQERDASRKPPAEAPGSPPPKPTYASRVAEARACLNKAKLHLSSSRNTKTEIKEGVIAALDRLYQLVKEAESENRGEERSVRREEDPIHPPISSHPAPQKEDSELRLRLEEHCRLMIDNTKKMEELNDRLLNHQTVLGGASYASVAAGNGKAKPTGQTTLHSVVVTSKDEMETGEEVLSRIRKAVNAKEGGVTIDKVRKARDRKIIVGCRSVEERDKVKERIRKAGDHLQVEDIKNKDPLLILKDVLSYNTDDDILLALQKQNVNIFKDLREEDAKIEIKYKRKTRNPLANHIVIQVSPKIWTRVMQVDTVQIDLQRVRVADQSPLVQCSLCLGYGHGRRFCTETTEKCSHCAGPHKKSDCPDWTAGAAPKCCNCTKAKMEQAGHNAFSQDCPIRRRWDALARATTAYC